MPAIMTSRQSAELDFAFERNGWTAEDVKKLSMGDALSKFLTVLRGRAEIVTKSILTAHRSVNLEAEPAITTSKEYFEGTGVKWMGEDFKREFLGLELEAVPEAVLVVQKLEEASVDEPIRAELGDRAEISVQHFVAFLNRHRGSSEWFIFYLKDKNGDLWAVRADWRADVGWRVGAHSGADPRRWLAGHRVVSRN